jgi:hypothetical protein
VASHRYRIQTRAPYVTVLDCIQYIYRSRDTRYATFMIHNPQYPYPSNVWPWPHFPSCQCWHLFIFTTTPLINGPWYSTMSCSYTFSPCQRVLKWTMTSGITSRNSSRPAHVRSHTDPTPRDLLLFAIHCIIIMAYKSLASQNSRQQFFGSDLALSGRCPGGESGVVQWPARLSERSMPRTSLSLSAVADNLIKGQ